MRHLFRLRASNRWCGRAAKAWREHGVRITTTYFNTVAQDSVQQMESRKAVDPDPLHIEPKEVTCGFPQKSILVGPERMCHLQR